MWNVSSFLKPDEINTIEMVLIDEKGDKIHATIRKQLLYIFQPKIIEGGVYKMSFFSVGPSSGGYRTTLHPYKLLFQMKTKIQSCVENDIPQYGLSLSSIADISSHTVDYEYLVDIIGLLTGISAEREYLRDGKVTKMMVLELTDHGGKCECALFGDYVDLVQKMIGKRVGGMPIVVVQFAKIKIFRDKASIQNVLSATRILVDPEIEEVAIFKNGLASHGIDFGSVVPVLGPRVRPSFVEDFLRLYPKKTIAQLVDLVDDGIFVVSGVVDDFVEDEEWWYPACRCHKFVTADSGAYYCKGCVKHVFNMVPRYKVKVKVTDGTQDVIFVIFDGDMQYLLDKPCVDLVSAAKADNAGFYPTEICNLKGVRLLFKVEISSSSPAQFDGSYRVRRVCKDPSVAELFEVCELNQPPTEELSNDVHPDGVAVDVEEEFVEETQIADFVSDIIVTPHPHVGSMKSESNQLSVDVTVPSSLGDFPVVSLDDDTDDRISSIVTGVGKRKRNSSRATGKRNLGALFDESEVGGASASTKSSKTAKD